MSTKKGDFLQKFYEALANGDTDYLVEHIR